MTRAYHPRIDRPPHREQARMERLKALEDREQYACSACAVSCIGMERAEHHLVFAHGVGRERAREALVREALVRAARPSTDAIAR